MAPTAWEGPQDSTSHLCYTSGEYCQGPAISWGQAPGVGHTKPSFTDCGSVLAPAWIYVPKAWGSTALANSNVKKALRTSAISAWWVTLIHLSKSVFSFCFWLLFLDVPEEAVLVVFGISGQFHFKLRFCLSSCTSVHPSNALLVLNRNSIEGLSSALHLGEHFSLLWSAWLILQLWRCDHCPFGSHSLNP